MLQRAASNAYSWWWASHIRTKQSKWLDQSLQDMEERVIDTLNTLQDEGDSFATRAEMYYKKRPELVDFVEETFRAYRALAERYDKLSKDLQSANRTLASVFPDQVQYRTEEDDEEEEETRSNNGRNNNTNTTVTTTNNNSNNEALIPKAPSIPDKGNFRSPSMLLSRKGPPPKRTSSSIEKDVKVAGPVLSKKEALGEIDKIQKEILTLQTEKEFVRSLYERAYNQYWEFEDRITVMQKSVCSLQDEYGVGTVIEDDEARTLMAAAALKSCQDTLAKLQEIQAQSSEEAKVEFERVKEAHEMFETLRDQFISKYLNQDESKIATLEEEEEKQIDDARIQVKVKENKLEEDSNEVITVTKIADRINQLVNKVVTLETTVSSQTGLVQRLRSETDELQTNIKKLEEEKEVLIEGSEVTNQKLKEVEEELKRVKLLNRTVQSQDNSIRTHFTEASYDVKHLSEKLNNMKPDVEEEIMVLYKKNKNNVVDDGDKEDVKTTLTKKDVGGDAVPEGVQNMSSGDGEIESHDLSRVDSNKGDEPNWRQLYISGLDDREKILLDEYTSVLRDYKDVKIKLNDVEKKNRDSLFEMALQLREMKNALANKDQEINYLHQKLNSPNSAADNPDVSPFTMETEYKYTPNEEALLQKAEATQEANLPLPHLESNNSPLITLDNANAIKSPSSENTPEKLLADQSKLEGLSTMEKKFRSDIDDLLEKSLEFWLRFGTSINQIQKYQNSIQDLKADLRHIQESHMRSSSEGGSSKRTNLQSQLKPIFKHLREIRTELSLWLEHNTVLQVEMQDRHSSLCNLHDEIIRASNLSSGEEENMEVELIISPYQAAKLQGEIMNLKQQNNTVASELQAGLSLVSGMKNDVDKTLDELDNVISTPKSSQGSSKNTRIPLKSFLFGVKLKKHKQKQSLFACVNPNVHKSDMEEEADSPVHTPKY